MASPSTGHRKVFYESDTHSNCLCDSPQKQNAGRITIPESDPYSCLQIRTLSHLQLMVNLQRTSSRKSSKDQQLFRLIQRQLISSKHSCIFFSFGTCRIMYFTTFKGCIVRWSIVRWQLFQIFLFLEVSTKCYSKSDQTLEKCCLLRRSEHAALQETAVLGVWGSKNVNQCGFKVDRLENAIFQARQLLADEVSAGRIEEAEVMTVMQRWRQQKRKRVSELH